MNTRMHDATRLYDACGFHPRYMHLVRMSGGGAQEIFDAVQNPAFIQTKHTHKENHDTALQRKLWRVRRMVCVLAHMPFVRAVAVCNSLALQTVHEKSDIDIFIVAARGRVWSARAWVAGVLALLRLRPGEARRDPVCASFFVDETVTDLTPLMLERDVYFHFWLRSLMPMAGEHLLFAEGISTTPLFRVVQYVWLQRALGWCAAAVAESFIRRHQEKIFPAEITAAALRPDTGVVLSDTIIKLHTNDRRREFRDAVYGHGYEAGGAHV